MKKEFSNKTLVKHSSCDGKCKFGSKLCNSNQESNNDKSRCECKKYPTYKNNYSWNPGKCISKNSSHLKSIIDDSVIVCDEIISITDNVSTNVTNTTPTNVTNTVSINSYDKKVRHKTNCYILHMFSLATILLLRIAIICYHYIKYRSKRKNIDTLTM